jgi:hypothetical protein
MWMLSFLPDFVIHLIFIAGVLGTIAGFVLGFIPMISRYKLPIQVISLVLLSAGLWFEGGLANEARYKAEHERLKAEIVRKEAEAKALNTKLSAASAERDAAIADRGDKIIQTVDRYIKGDPVQIVKEINLSDEERAKLQQQIEELQKAEKECKIPSLLIEQVNAAAERPQGAKKP